jgi:flagellar biosynthetic protein FlhB
LANSASERTEEATPRRKQKEREKGNISKSQDFNAALIVTIGVGILGAFSSNIISSIKTMLYYTFTHLNPKYISQDDILLILLPFVKALSQILLPFLVLLAISTVIIIRMQVGHVFAPEKIKFDLGNLAPSKFLQNAKKLFNPAEPRNIVEFIKSLVKLLIVFSCGYSVLNARKDELYGLMGLNISTSFIVISSILTQMFINMCLAMLLIGILDKKFQDHEYDKSIKMTKQEIKDEMKDTEGDPKIKARIRSIQMKMAHQRMMAKVATADVVVTNPTHYAVALEYNKLKSSAPKVVAKGVDFVAFKIREIAQNNKVPIVENPPLARALYKLVKIDDIIPSEMFVAVAEVLAYVYNKNKSGR